AAHCVAFVWPAPISYNARNRSRVRGCSASTDSRRKSASVCPHFAGSGRTILPPLCSLQPYEEGFSRTVHVSQNYDSESIFTLVDRHLADTHLPVAGQKPCGIGHRQ